MRNTQKFFLCIPLLLLCVPASASEFLNDVSKMKLPDHYVKTQQAKPDTKKKVKKATSKSGTSSHQSSGKDVTATKELKALRIKVDELSRKNAQLAAQANKPAAQTVHNQDEYIRQLKVQLDKKDKIAASLQSRIEVLTKNSMVAAVGTNKSATVSAGSRDAEVKQLMLQLQQKDKIAAGLQSQVETLTKKNAMLTSSTSKPGASSFAGQPDEVKQLKVQLEKRDKIAATLQSQVEALTKKTQCLLLKPESTLSHLLLQRVLLPR